MKPASGKPGAVQAAPKQERQPRPRKALPSHLERIEIVIEPDDLVCRAATASR